MLKSALLSYHKFRDDLVQDGFQVNPYDPYVANKQIKGSQMTVAWHVDDLKVSHKDQWEVTKMAIFLSKIYGNVKVQWGNKLQYLGMDLDYTTPDAVKISMIRYIENIIKNFTEEIIGTAATPATEYLFEVQGDTKSST